jgi:hypothetical protein
MASNEETMRLNAELSLAKFSPQAKQMVKDLAEIKKATDEAHSPAAKVAKLHAKAYQELREKIGGTAETIRGILSPSMAALGITGFAAGEALGSMVEKIKDAAKNYNILNDASRRSGMSVDTINAVSIAFQRLGQDGPQAIQSMAEFGEAMAKFDRNSPKERLKWAGAYADVIDQLGNKMKGKSRLEQLDEAFKFNQRTDVPLDIKRDIDQNLLHLDPSIATKTGQELREALQKGFAYEKEHPDNPILNKAAADAMANLNESMAGFKDNMFEAFGPKSVKLIDAFAPAIDFVGERIKAAAEKLHSFFTEFDHVASKPAEALKKWLDSPSSPPGKPSAYKGAGGVGEGQSGWSPAQMLGAGMQPVSYSTGGGGGDKLSESVKVGMLAAFREWFSSVSSSGAGGGGGGGITNASYSPSGGSGGKWGGGGYTDMGNSVSPRGRRGGGGPTGVSGGDGITTPPSGSLAAQRAGYAKELSDNPALRSFAIDAMQHEGGIQSNMEQLYNYAAMHHMSIYQALHSHQYGPVNTGQITGRISEKTRRLGEAAIAKVDAGSNITDYSTDQGMARDPNFAKYMANPKKYNMHKVEGAWFSYHGEQGRAWAEKQRQRDLLVNSKAANINGGPQKVEGDAHLKVDLNGLPKGTTADLSYNGLFKNHTLTKGFQMQPATRE